MSPDLGSPQSEKSNIPPVVISGRLPAGTNNSNIANPLATTSISFPETIAEFQTAKDSFPSVSKFKALLEITKLAWQTDPKLFSLEITRSISDSLLTVSSAWIWSKWINAMFESFGSGELSSDLIKFFILSSACGFLHTEHGDGIINRVCDYFATKFSNKFDVAIENKINKGITSLNIRTAENSEVQQRIIRVDENPVAHDIVNNSVLECPKLLLNLSIAGSTLFLYDWRLGLLLTAATIPSIWQERRYVNRSFEVESLNSRPKLLRSWFDWSIRRNPALREIATLKKGQFFADSAKTLHNEVAERTNQLEKEFLIPRMLCSAIFYATETAVFFQIMKSAVQGQLEIDKVLFFLGMLGTYTSAFHNISVQLIDLSEKLLYAQDTVGLIKNSKPDSRPQTVDNDHFGELGLELKNIGLDLSFQPEDPEADTIHISLKDINLSILPGQITAITGPSGSGKSTLLKIIKGILVPETGQLTFTDISGEKPITLDQAFDEVHLSFSEIARLAALSVEQTVRLGEKEGRTPMDYQQSLELAGVDFLDQFADGDQTLIGKDIGGVDPSTGQAARISFARALYSRRAIWCLDEPFAHLDWITAKNLLDRIKAMAADGLSVVFVTHDVNLLGYADQVLVLSKDGTVDFTGSPEDAKINSDFIREYSGSNK